MQQNRKRIREKLCLHRKNRNKKIPTDKKNDDINSPLTPQHQVVAQTRSRLTREMGVGAGADSAVLVAQYCWSAALTPSGSG